MPFEAAVPCTSLNLLKWTDRAKQIKNRMSLIIQFGVIKTCIFLFRQFPYDESAGREADRQMPLIIKYAVKTCTLLSFYNLFLTKVASLHKG